MSGQTVYSYAWNDPLKYIDPSGHSLIGSIVGLIAAFIVACFAPELLGEDFALVTGEYGGLTAMAAGFVGGFVGALVSTGSLDAAFEAGIIGGITAALFYGAGTYAQQSKGSEWEIEGKGAIAHSVVGCVSAVLSSGNCGRGALSAAVSYLATPYIFKFSLGEWSAAPEAAEAGLIGGITSRITGGNFTDGFSTGAAGYLFNSIAHSFTRVPFTTDAGVPILDISGRPMMKPDDVNPGDFLSEAESPEGQSLQMRNFARGGPWDFQRVGEDRVFTGDFTDFANVMIGLYGAALNDPVSVVLTVANHYAQGSDFGRNAVMDPDYPNLRVQNVYDIKLGYSLFTSGAIRATQPPTPFISPY